MHTRIEVVKSTMGHVYELTKRMKKEDALTAVRLGLDPKKALRQFYKTSLFTKTAFVDGKIAAMWGIRGTFLGAVGEPWLLTTCAVDEVPFGVLSCYRRELNTMLKWFPILEEWVDATHTKSIRLLKFMGFVFDEPSKIGFKGAEFIRAEKRA